MNVVTEVVVVETVIVVTGVVVVVVMEAVIVITGVVVMMVEAGWR